MYSISDELNEQKGIYIGFHCHLNKKNHTFVGFEVLTQ